MDDLIINRGEITLRRKTEYEVDLPMKKIILYAHEKGNVESKIIIAIEMDDFGKLVTGETIGCEIRYKDISLMGKTKIIEEFLLHEKNCNIKSKHHPTKFEMVEFAKKYVIENYPEYEYVRLKKRLPSGEYSVVIRKYQDKEPD